MSQPLAPVPGQNGPSNVVPVNASGEPSKNTILVQRMHAKAMDPAFQPYGKRAYAPKERCGACYGTQVGFEAHTAPEAGFTQANGRIFPAAIQRTAPNFQMGAASSI
jgi:hypothetical protein